MTTARDLKRRLRSRRPMFGGWTSLAHPSITEILARSGVDFIGIDLEHSTISQEQAQRIIAASQAGQAACLPRVAAPIGADIRRLLDSGADGIIVPNIRSRSEVDRIVESLCYPPIGKRSYGISRAQGYGFDFDSYVSRWNRRAVLIVQIESVEGVEAAEDLISHPQVDGVMMGPYDLSGSLGLPGQLSHRRVREACAEVIETCRKFGKACGTQIVDPTRESVAEHLRQGYTFAVLSSDVFLLWKWSQRMRELIHEIRVR